MTEPHYIVAGWLFDGSGKPVARQMLLAVKEGRWAGWEPCSGERLAELSAQAVVEELSHCTILPPLVDGRAHLALSATTDLGKRQEQQRASPEQLRLQLSRHLRDHFSHGILAVADPAYRQVPSSPQGQALRHWQDATEAADFPLPIRLCPDAGEKEPDPSPGGFFQGPCQGREQLEELARQGGAWMPSLLALKSQDPARLPEQLALVAEARSLGVRLVVGTCA
ncbi:hypothetical protein [Desulfogranum mediterraneum]|uniref:hypothetical protein n=1 Tax=Desulfogranum mediterraneum TaxID=160661 RepID=UPI0004047DCB|nr:hypothetical protein [Desulfogranum mediterraneum]